MCVQLPKNRTLELREGGEPAEIIYRLREPPNSLCTDANCRVYIEFDIELGNYPRCRSGKPIVQAVLAGTDNACGDMKDSEDDNDENNSESFDDEDSDEDINDDTDDVTRASCSSKTKTDNSNEDIEDIEDDSTLFLRRVTAKNWNVSQTVSVVAKLDFKYDGTQVRQLGVWLRKVNNDGQTIERRSLAKFTVSWLLLSVEFYSQLYRFCSDRSSTLDNYVQD